MPMFFVMTDEFGSKKNFWRQAVPLIEDKLFRKIKKLTGKAIGDFGLIDEGDRILVAVSGGKDSYVLLHLLEALRRRAPVTYELVAVNVDPGIPGYRKDRIEGHFREHGFRYHMESSDFFRIIEEKRRTGTSYCSFCARLRRGVLYTVAQRLGCNKIALGHHLDDFIETLLLNQFYVGTLAAMSPKLLADNGQQTVIRPLVYVEEADIREFALKNTFPIVCCCCQGCETAYQKRQRIKGLIEELSKENPHIRQSMISALGNIQPRHLMDKKLKRF
jgi:tRNA 2-thiocytidine biosynthesis protein TtcA